MHFEETTQGHASVYSNDSVIRLIEGSLTTMAFNNRRIILGRDGHVTTGLVCVDFSLVSDGSEVGIRLTVDHIVSSPVYLAHVGWQVPSINRQDSGDSGAYDYDDNMSHNSACLSNLCVRTAEGLSSSVNPSPVLYFFPPPSE